MIRGEWGVGDLVYVPGHGIFTITIQAKDDPSEWYLVRGDVRDHLPLYIWDLAANEQVFQPVKGLTT